MKLGIVYKNGRMINHRSFIKVVFNPILRYFGHQIGTLVDIDGSEITGITIGRCRRTKTIKWEKYSGDYDYIEPKRRLF